MIKDEKKSMMKHYDEKTLELFVMESKKVEDQKVEFEEHLRYCNRCNKFYNEIAEFYRIYNEDLPEIRQKNKSQFPPLLPEPRTGLMKYIPTSIIVYTRNFSLKIIRFVKKRPFISGIGITIFFILFFLRLDPFGFFKDNNPVYFKHNDENRMLEIYNKSGEKLWQLKYSVQIGGIESISRRYSQVSDLDKDGKNEIITILPLNNEEGSGKFLYILDYKRTLILKKEFDENFKFRDQDYFPDFHTSNLLIYEHDGNEKNEIFVLIGHRHQPIKLIRLDYRGNILGEYWHFGGFGSMILMDVNKDGKKEIILGGVEDIEHNAALLALDPLKIIGKTESSQIKGFGYKTSEAEIFYIRLSNPEFVDALKSRAIISSINPINDSILITTYSLGFFQVEYGTDYNLLYYFDFNLKLKSIMSNDNSKKAHIKLMKLGKLPQNFNENKFLENLKNNLEYWDGKKWRKEWCRVGVQ